MTSDAKPYGKDVSLIFEKVSKSNTSLLKNYNCDEDSINLHISGSHERSVNEHFLPVYEMDMQKGT